MDRTTCCVIGGGPAGMVLGLLLSRAGVDVTVVEKHGDFLRDFRGDTVHASTLTLLDELGLAETFANLPHRLLSRMALPVAPGRSAEIDMSRLPGRHQHMAIVPQWDLLDMIAEAARSEPTFHLWMNTEATGLVTTDGRVAGITYRTRDGRTGELAADLTVACDGRHSTLRAASGLRCTTWQAPMDLWWFRLPRRDSDPVGFGTIVDAEQNQIVTYLDRGDYFQIGIGIQKGADARWRAEGLAAFHNRVATAMPWLADRVHTIGSLDRVRLLDVRMDRLHRWYKAGLLCIGDAAHAMSPVGGVGVNLAVQDAVAAATLLARPLRAGTLTTRQLVRVQWRRWLPTVVTQGLQRLLHAKVIGPTVDGNAPGGGGEDRQPWPQRLLTRFPILRVIPAYLIAVGVRPEHAPDFARRPSPARRTQQQGEHT